MKLIDIHSPQDIKPLTIDDLKDLAKQIRAAIINYTSTIGGHVGPNLGDVDKSKFTEIGEFTDPNESPEYDIFYAGHTSPSISLAFGLAKARRLQYCCIHRRRFFERRRCL